MRLLSFVPCGCRAGPIDDAPPSAAAADHHHAAGGDAEARRRRRRRRRAAAALAAAGSPSPLWRPALGDICELGEYGATVVDGGRGAKVAPARVGKAAAWDVVGPRGRGDEYRPVESASSMRGFAPTAFLF